jgi:hypothetical protein
MSMFELSVYSPTIEETLEEKWHQTIEDRRNSRSKMAGTVRGCGLQRRQVPVLTEGEHQ